MVKEKVSEADKGNGEDEQMAAAEPQVDSSKIKNGGLDKNLQTDLGA